MLTTTVAPQKSSNCILNHRDTLVQQMYMYVCCVICIPYRSHRDQFLSWKKEWMTAPRYMRSTYAVPKDSSHLYTHAHVCVQLHVCLDHYMCSTTCLQGGGNTHKCVLIFVGRCNLGYIDYYITLQ